MERLAGKPHRLPLRYPLAYWIAHRSPVRQRRFLVLILTSFWTSSLVKNFAWLVRLGRNGPFSNLLHYLGMPGEGTFCSIEVQ
ncbi:hypothetical protein [Rhizobium lusitanum]|uniref:ABC-type spermidine/putrescine transport system permease subunit I n=1 Tax=Rhizobium lusitanum TaxID=293958 RepID=A0A7X0IVE0_9HYPH|nr:hypothetical protein [Rhizobium lusitanum]MBB6487908.1 ABC-type spermidine/putrescine transport system permease subunit I [Rhizobium lusitanum]